MTVKYVATVIQVRILAFLVKKILQIFVHYVFPDPGAIKQSTIFLAALKLCQSRLEMRNACVRRNFQISAKIQTSYCNKDLVRLITILSNKIKH
jgi:hypothetical protein